MIFLWILMKAAFLKNTKKGYMLLNVGYRLEFGLFGDSSTNQAEKKLLIPNTDVRVSRRAHFSIVSFISVRRSVRCCSDWLVRCKGDSLLFPRMYWIRQSFCLNTMIMLGIKASFKTHLFTGLVLHQNVSSLFFCILYKSCWGIAWFIEVIRRYRDIVATQICRKWRDWLFRMAFLNVSTKFSEFLPG